MSFSYVRLIQMAKEIKDKNITKKIAEYRDIIYTKGNSEGRKWTRNKKGALDTLDQIDCQILNQVGEKYLHDFPDCEVA